MDSITSSLNEYSSTVSEYTVKIMNALLPVASIIILIFFLIELFRWNERLGQEGGSLTIRLWLEISIGYVISFILIHNIAHLFDGVVFLFNRAFVLVDRVLPQTQFNTTVDVSGVDGWIMQQLVSFVGGVANFVANVVSNLLVFMRFFQMYLLKAVSPLIIAFFMSAQTRPISINFFKHFSAYAFQGVLAIELKTDVCSYPGIEAALVRLVAQQSWTFRIVYSSFNHQTLVRIRELDPQAEVALLFAHWRHVRWRLPNGGRIQGWHVPIQALWLLRLFRLPKWPVRM